MKVRLRFSTEASADLRDIYDYISERAGFDVADAYVDRIEQACRPLLDTPLLGAPHADFQEGLRTIAFERCATIFYRVEGWEVVIDRVVPKDAMRGGCSPGGTHHDGRYGGHLMIQSPPPASANP